MIDINAQLEAVDRTVRTEDVEGVPSRVQTLVQTYPSPIDDVWDAVTSADRITRWFLPVSGDLRLGGQYRLEGNASGTIQSCEPPQAGTAQYDITWEFGGGVTFVTVRLESVGSDRTRLELQHVAPVSAVPDELWQQFGPAGTGIGWDSGLLGLSLHLTDPDARPEDPEAWTRTDEGRSFLRGSADAWAVAHAGDGIEIDLARTAADTTYAMYTGEGPGPS
ncbi:SRPBCC domain-containing protein [Agromyces sp. Marseille-P2726]|uniref:SRPBCC domain-containing protein n=1 Tax=Agromyces sp. Marseille-P2726 TaxID=2709132 RepID=UPI0015704794|nr:SRPBCC domain-containing protein [Agromyces sp. Marseille-P2726]